MPGLESLGEFVNAVELRLNLAFFAASWQKRALFQILNLLAEVSIESPIRGPYIPGVRTGGWRTCV